MKTEEFSGHSSQMRGDSPWLASEDLLGRGDVQVTIGKCFFHRGAEFDEGRKEDVYALSFEGKSKQLVLNATNRRTLVSLYGADVARWAGQEDLALRQGRHPGVRQGNDRHSHSGEEIAWMQ